MNIKEALKMTIKDGLKEKNKLVKKITDLMARTEKYNSVDNGAVRSYNPEASLNQAIDVMEQLISLKTSIHTANIKVYDKIFRMAEYKSFVKWLKNMNCTEGTVVLSRYGDVSNRQLTTVITEVQRDQMIEHYESAIDALQSELDTHNVVTLLAN